MAAASLETSFGVRIKEIIRMVGSADCLARKSGMSARAIGQYAAGTSEPTRTKILALAAAVDINALWLLTGEGPKLPGEVTPSTLSTPPSSLDLEATQGSGPTEVFAESLRMAKQERRPQVVGETLRLILELENYQIELEQQNAELRRTREERELLLQWFTELYECAPVGHFTCDFDGVISSLNLAGATILGSTRSKLIGSSFHPFIVSPDRPAFTSFLGKVLSGMGKQIVDLSLRPQKGNHPLYVHLEALASTSRQQCHIAAIDISKYASSSGNRRLP
jgi:PAS domain S-box-containing protein